MRKPIVRWAVGWWWPPGIPEAIDACLCALLLPGALVTLYGLRHKRWPPLPVVGRVGPVTVCRNADSWYGISGYASIDACYVADVCRMIAADYTNKGDEND